MAKTKGADSHDYKHFLEVMTPFLQRGCSLHDVCLKCKLPYDAILAKTKRDQKYLQKIKALQVTPVILAETTWVDKIKEGDYIASRDYLRAKRKNEYSERQEVESKTTVEHIDTGLEEKAKLAINENL